MLIASYFASASSTQNLNGYIGVAAPIYGSIV